MSSHLPLLLFSLLPLLPPISASLLAPANISSVSSFFSAVCFWVIFFSLLQAVSFSLALYFLDLYKFPFPCFHPDSLCNLLILLYLTSLSILSHTLLILDYHTVFDKPVELSKQTSKCTDLLWCERSVVSLLFCISPESKIWQTAEVLFYQCLVAPFN